ncbi:MAG TPA: hypothetical protein PKE47_11170, partial [Verrucomicrobiota bacterium]|nr:hypothetical protein [Verrucomicrobiota bacterium]
SYDGSASRRATVEVRNNPVAGERKPEGEAGRWPTLPGGRPDFAAMTPAQRQAYDAQRLKRRFG